MVPGQMLDRTQGPVVVSAGLESQGHPRILLVEDPGPMRNALADALRAKGYGIECAGSEGEAVDWLITWNPELVLLDLSVHDGLGMTICRRVHVQSDVPIVLVAAPGCEAQVLMGLEIGATDYMVRPLDLDAVALRIGTAMAQTVRHTVPNTERALVAGPLTINVATRTIVVRGQDVHFPRKEYDLLLSLVTQRGHIRTRRELFDELWDRGPEDPKTLDAHIQRIRKKIELDRSHPRHVITVRGIGYYFDPHGEEHREALTMGSSDRHA